MGGILEAFNLAGKTAIVTGASRGLGAGMAVALAEAGADVALVARGDLGATRARVEAAGRRALEIHADLADRAQVATILPQVTAAWGAPDILVNNGGTIRRAALVEFSEQDWDDVLEINLSSLFRLSQAFVRALRAEGKKGKIIHIASLLSFQGGIRVASYTAAKSGVLGLTRIMANELAPLGINVNAIAPGYMATDNTQALREDPVRNKGILERIPAGRWGTPEDLAGTVVFLASGASDYLHGHCMAVDGGWLSR